MVVFGICCHFPFCFKWSGTSCEWLSSSGTIWACGLNVPLLSVYCDHMIGLTARS
jgi:hypothetical protein